MTRQTHFPHPESSTIRPALPFQSSVRPAMGASDSFDPAEFTLPYCDFMSKNPTVFHAVNAEAERLKSKGFTKLSSRDAWDLKAGGKYFVERNTSSLIAFAVGSNYKPGNGVSMVAGHVDALTARLRPVSKVDNKAGYVQLGVAPYAGAMNMTWWDRDLGIAGRVMVKESSGKVVQKLVDLHEPIARIPTLAPHFGAPANGPFNQETNMTPIIGLEDANGSALPGVAEAGESCLGGVGSFASTQPPRLVKRIAKELGVQDYGSILNWELELYDSQPAQVGGLDREFIYAGRIDDKLCSWAAIEALLLSSDEASSTTVRCVGLFDDEEVGSLLRQGARSSFLPSTIERIVDSMSKNGTAGSSLMARTFANSFLLSADVNHAVNPNFLNVYLAGHAPKLNVGVAIAADTNAHMTTDAVSTAFLQRVADKCGSTLQVFHIRNDSRSGGTVGPMLSSAMGCRAIDAGIPQLSMHSIRATTGSLDPGLGVKLFRGFFDHFEVVDAEFRND